MSLEKLAKCLDTLVGDGALSREQAEDAYAEARRNVRKNAESMAMPEAERMAAEQVLKRKAAEARRNRVLVAMQADKVMRIDAAAASHPNGFQAGALAHLTKDWWGKSKVTNVEYRASVVHSVLDRAALELTDRYAPKALGFKEQVAGLRSVVRELFGEDTGDAMAKAAAKAWRETAEKAKEWFNRAGGAIGTLDTWRLPQSHDMVRIGKAGFEKWARFLDDIGAEIFDDGGNPLRGPERLTVLRDVFDTVSTGGMNKVSPGAAGQGKKLANRHGESRVLHFPDADGWLKYHEDFGAGSLFGTFAGHLKSMSRDIALLEVLGPNPAATARWMADMADKAEPGSGRMVRRTYDSLEGNAEMAHGWRRYLYAAMGGTRNLLRSAQMGSATLSAVTDLATVKATAEWNGLEASKVLRWYMGQINPTSAQDRRFARRAGLVADITLKAISNSRVVDDDLGKGWTGRFANATFELSGLNAHTNGLRTAFQLESMGALAERSDKAWGDLEPPLRAMLERGGLDERLWDAARAGPKLKKHGVAFLDALELAASDDALIREAGIRIHSAILQETDMAVPVPDARARAIMTAGTQANTLVGELWKFTTMYKSYPVTVTMTHGFRAYDAALAKQGRGRLYGFTLAIGMTSLGALAVQMKQLAGGKDPRDMTDPKFWGQALAQGGGAGILGDFFGAALSRTDKDLAGTLAGTGFGLVSDVVNLVGRNALAEADGKPSNTIGDTVKFLQRYHPGSNLWWARTAVDRLGWAQLKLAVDPTIPQAFARMENRAMKDFGQQFWWHPGEMAPERAPDFGAVLGGSE